MRILNQALLIILLIILQSCQDKTEEIPNTASAVKSLKIESSSILIPLNEYGKATFKSIDYFGVNQTIATDFYVDDQLIIGHVFNPEKTGEYIVKGVLQGVESDEIVIKVEAPLNKKILVEYFTSRTCGWCPWIGYRVDSLHHANDRVISYSIHGEDYLEILGSKEMEENQLIGGRPAIRVNRSNVKNFDAPLEIEELGEEIEDQLSIQAPIEIAINTLINGQELGIEVLSKNYRNDQDSIYLTVLLVEDEIIIQNQSNYFVGHPYPHCPYVDQPNPIPEYKTHNVIRKYITEVLGDRIESAIEGNGEITSIGSYQINIDEMINISNSSIIVIVHKENGNLEKNTVLNSQMCRVGENVNFNE